MYIYGIIVVLFAAIIFIDDRNVLNPVFLFNMWWGLILLISSIGVVGLYIPENFTYVQLFTAIVSFNIPYFFVFRWRKRKTINKRNFVNMSMSNATSRIIFIFGFFVILVNIPLLYNNLKVYIEYNDLNIVRWMYFYSDNNFLKILRMFKSVILNPVMLLVNIFSFGFLIHNLYDKNSKKIFCLIILLNLIDIFSTLGRGSLLEIFLIIIIGFVNESFYNPSASKKINFKKIMYILIIPISILFIITLKRSVFDNVLGEVLIYYVSPIMYFEKLVKKVYIPVVSNNGSFLYGSLFFSGFLDLPVLFLRILGLNIKQPTYYLAIYNQEFLQVGNNILYNAFPTMNFSFLLDFGFIGLFVGPLLFSIIALYFYRKFMKYNNLKFNVIYIVILLAIYKSTLSFSGTSYNFWNVIILVYFLHFYMKKGRRKFVFFSKR